MRTRHDTEKSALLRDLEAFCATCPAPEEVTQGLEALGFELTFHMDMIPSSGATQTPALPAQYHYSDGSVMYNQKSTPFDPFEDAASVRLPKCSTARQGQDERALPKRPILQRGLDTLCGVH